jgi:hypothetical protein
VSLHPKERRSLHPKERRRRRRRKDYSKQRRSHEVHTERERAAPASVRNDANEPLRSTQSPMVHKEVRKD